MSLIGSRTFAPAPMSIQRGWGVWATHTDPDDPASYNRVGFAKSRAGAVAVVARLRGRPVHGTVKVSGPRVGYVAHEDIALWKVGSRGFGGEAYEIRGERGEPTFRIEHGDWDTKYNPGLPHLRRRS